MSDLDPDVSRWFVATDESLPGAEFQARVAAQLAGSRGWLNSYSIPALLQAAVSGIAAGVLTPFRLRFAYSTALIVTAAALTLWMGLQSA